MKVYHFLKYQYGLEAIRHNQLKIAEINQLNDPFEFLAYRMEQNELVKRVQNVKDKLSNHFGILCFSEKFNNPVQWAHYAEQHTGMCLGFEIPQELIHKIKYLKKRPPFPNFLNFDEKVMKKYLLKKFKHWEYEKEWRMYTELDQSKQSGSLYFEKFSDTLILREVILGIERQDFSELVGYLSQDSTFINTKVYTTRLSKNNFKIVKDKNLEI